MYFVHNPVWLQRLLSGFTWRRETDKPVLYLTFDDGPIPELTPWVLDVLKAHSARATFFCVGDNVRKHPAIYQRILSEGHAVGNHTFNHLNGIKTPLNTYLDNVAQCADQVQSRLFRPPYGRLTRAQSRALRSDYEIIMWDVLSADFDQTITPERCLDNVLRHARKGSIVVLHDNIKAAHNLRYALPRILSHFSDKGFQFEPLTAG
ncbi:MAG: polysaccharide deacetylase family protein [Saprospiraceae bacterium]|nr:polysaccharide deacetylase family protein [Saprospiraceae bacterium]